MNNPFDTLEEQDISYEDMSCYLDYDFKSGHLIWKKRFEEIYENPMHLKRFNDFQAGQKAGTVNNVGYVTVKIFGKTRRAHRIIWLLIFKEWPKGQIDHVDGDRTNNKQNNLRDSNWLENMRNRKLNKNSTSGFRGVYWNLNECKWRAHIKDHGKNINLGYFDSFEKAVEARIEAEKYIGFHENHGKILTLKGV